MIETLVDGLDPDGLARFQAAADAERAAAVLAIAPHRLGGAVLRARDGPVRDRWLALATSVMEEGAPLRRLPSHIQDDRLLGGLDLTATLASGAPVLMKGLLAEADGGLIIAPMAERMGRGLAARLASVLDHGEVRVERDGAADRFQARFGLVTLDEGVAPDEAPPEALLDRLAFLIDLSALRAADIADWSVQADAVAHARRAFQTVRHSDADLEACCAAALALGLHSLRAAGHALAVARLSAALDGRGAVGETDLAFAARTVLIPRATVAPDLSPPDQPPEPPPEPPEQDGSEGAEETEDTITAADDLAVEAVAAMLPPDLLEKLRQARGPRKGAGSAGKGAEKKNQRRGRPAGLAGSPPYAGARPHLIETLRAASPWQKLRAARPGADAAAPNQIAVRKDDFRYQRLKQRSQAVTIFVVDASGSAALQRMGEAKGAVELLLADCYIRRDLVSLIAFRRDGAELLLPPTRSLTRAKRSLSSLPGGGATPLAHGLDLAFQLAEAEKRAGRSPSLVVLTDGRGNIARNGEADRRQAAEDAAGVARSIQALGVPALVVDTSARPDRRAQELAQAMAARYLPLPRGDARTLAAAVQSQSGARAVS
ncbi:MAG: magnesium chelatase subunit D [Alphaproteobacteria bacterium]|nr:magnesium chelatase subunit D [Alphaproteobacteria bacterium]